MKNLFLAIAGAMGLIPGVFIVVSGIGVPPDTSRLAFGGIVEALGAISLLVIAVKQDELKRLKDSKIIKWSLLLVLMGSILLFSYLLLYGHCVVRHETKDATVYFPIWVSGKAAALVTDSNGRYEAVDKHGKAAVNEAIKQMGSVPITITNSIMLFLYQGVFTSLTIAFGLLGFYKSAIQEAGGSAAEKPRPIASDPAQTHQVATKDFDIFLAHNNQDKPQVEAVAAELRKRGLNPWLDKEQIPPGRWFQDNIQDIIPKVKSAAIFVGPHGIGKWQEVELRSFISQCVEGEIPVIPVLLPGVSEVPPKLAFLKQLSWVRFDGRIDDVKPLDDLVWGITGKNPQKY